MYIELDNAFIWFLPNAKVHLSEENRGPVDIDYASLSEQEKLMVINGLKSKKIKSDTKLEVLLPIQPQSPLKVEKLVSKKLTAETVNELHSSLLDTIKPILNKHISTLKKEIGSMNDIRQLRLMLELESKNKKRKTVIELLESRLNYLSNTIQDTLSKDNPDTSQPLLENSVDKLAANMDVTDTEVEVRTIDISME